MSSESEPYYELGTKTVAGEKPQGTLNASVAGEKPQGTLNASPSPAVQ